MDERHSRALDRAHALADQWSEDPRPISRAEAAELLSMVLRLDGWAVGEPAGARLRLVPAVEAPEPQSTAHGPSEPRPGPGMGLS
ncbi:hypothetical protein [Streptomyces asiaticus]|uniref:hypothetical protein n=1 Tax=Streptomyces asiaticus TaxID=114695 RepID=UPI001BA78A3F|nr:hypothetical protein [Streptomyces asiaticus]